MSVPYVALLLAVSLTTPVADNIPKLDVTPSCRAAARDAAAAETKSTFDSCLQAENNAHDQLVQQWLQFSQVDRRNCGATVAGFEPTYSELITCLEMARDLRHPPQGATIPAMPDPRPSADTPRPATNL
ncbi:MAG: hypothetical protein ACXWJ5_08135 [Xanthobacteraceae bacterium]